MARPRLDGEREPNGRRKRKKRRPTPEDHGARRLLARRSLDDPVNGGRDPRAGYPLGQLWLRGLICPAFHEAGLRYARLSAIVWGGNRTARSHLARLQPDERDAEDPPSDGSPERIERWLARKEIELQEAVDAVRQLGPGPFNVLENVAVHEHRMRFLDVGRLRQTPAAVAADLRQVRNLQLALGALVAKWEIACH